MPNDTPHVSSADFDFSNTANGQRPLPVALATASLAFVHAPQGALARLARQGSSGRLLLHSQLVQIHVHPAHARKLPLTLLIPAARGRLVSGRLVSSSSFALHMLGSFLFLTPQGNLVQGG